MSDPLVLASDPGASFTTKEATIRAALDRVLASGWYVLGKEVEAFEEEFATFHGKGFRSVGVGNGTDATCSMTMGNHACKTGSNSQICYRKTKFGNKVPGVCVWVGFRVRLRCGFSIMFRIGVVFSLACGAGILIT